MTLADLVRRVEPDGRRAAALIWSGERAEGVEPTVYVEDPIVDPARFALVEETGFCIELVNALWGAGGPRS